MSGSKRIHHLENAAQLRFQALQGVLQRARVGAGDMNDGQMVPGGQVLQPLRLTGHPHGQAGRHDRGRFPSGNHGHRTDAAGDQTFERLPCQHGIAAEESHTVRGGSRLRAGHRWQPGPVHPRRADLPHPCAPPQ